MFNAVGNEWVFLLVQILLAIIGVILSYNMRALSKTIESLQHEHQILHKRITDNREDVLLNHPRHDHIHELKKDLLTRIGQMESSMKSMFAEHERKFESKLSRLESRPYSRRNIGGKSV